jgi:hypothetical protein
LRIGCDFPGFFGVGVGFVVFAVAAGGMLEEEDKERWGKMEG